MQRTQYNSGQVGIIMLLITVVMLTVGISAISRTTSDVNISTTNEQGSRALDMAESGIEQALSTDLATAPSSISVQSSDPNVTVQTEVVRQNVLETAVDQGNSVAIDAGSSVSQVTIQWAKESACAAQASLVISVLGSDAADPVRRIYVGPAASCLRGDGFSAATAPVSSAYKLQTTIATKVTDKLIRIRPLYFGTDLSIFSSNPNFPTQSYVITSTAQNITSKESKAIQVERTLPAAPSVLDYVLYSGTSITQ